MTSLRKARRLIKETIAEWQEQEVSLLASALAYSTVFSLAPLMILVIMIMGVFFGETTAREQIVSQLDDLLGDDAANLMAAAITNLRDQASEGPLQLILNLGFFLFGASSVFAGIQNSLDRIWDVKPEPGRHMFHFLRKRLLSAAMILAIAFLLLVSSVANTLLAVAVTNLNEWLPAMGYLWQILSWVVSFGAITAVFAAIYTVLPDADIHWQDTLIGAILTAGLFMVGQWLFGIFLDWVDIGSGYGVAGSFLVIITWIFYAAIILFSGAVFTKVYARRYGLPIVPSDFAVSTTEDRPER
ncbi:YihY/virulence factor BrkB family protein [Nodosilinea sp. E11]|uniref:YihY/virulence factor BrkB family protein n=1 Tax=Nodosilinea sp. E11 TaxID=3037479 RepID=UPI0029346B69|nr:YihY/virulence factor BrkB family protein [Nodosilinea sp. E11]WOD41707.1 YihY/virulence factor BrkB family protein [Nodosilinea sp. E11]